MKNQAILIFLLSVLLNQTESKIFEKCEFVKTLRSLEVPDNQLATWTCIANYESHFDTKAKNSNTGDYGILQLSHLYWCSDSNTPGGDCHTTCSQFLNDDIKDDVTCARHIYDVTQKQSGNGFSAWTTYNQHCKGDVSSFTSGC
ncbi:lysozyme C-1-like [Coccinella septempunctata]|uniref:lysozyme C-1-like n=1 Tax=Coccinella septempunctata TaxID=41139 RepID=UPI001D0780C6|nr:lysozyme C-1-like [Coccinella septempunctata]